MEVEENGTLTFLDVLVIRKPLGFLGVKVHSKPTHTDTYLNAAKDHHQAQKLVLN